MDLNSLQLGDIIAGVEQLEEQQRAEAMLLLKTISERRFYQLNPINWIEDNLGISKETIKWSLNPGYEALDAGPRIMDDGTVIPKGWDGTRDPLFAAMEALASWRNVVVQSSTGTGKTFLAALATLWFLDVFPNSKVFTVAPKEDQLKDNLWGEISRFKEIFRGGANIKDFMSLEIRLSEIWKAKGVVAAVRAGEEVSSKTAGAHAEHMLWILDETQGIEKAILEAIENTCTAPHNLILALGNPRHKEDSLHKMYLREDFVSIQVSSYDHPNIVMNSSSSDIRTHNIIVPGAVSWKSIFTRRTKYGPEAQYYNNNPTYKALVRGIVPAGAELSMFTEKTLEILDNHMEKDAPVPVYERIHQPRNGKHLEGFTRVYEYPLHTHSNRYVLFGDVAEDSGRGDWHACIVLDRITKKVVALIHMRGHREEYVDEILAMADRYKVFDPGMKAYSLPIVNWERNAGGALHLVKKFADYPNLYIHRSYTTADDQKFKDNIGWFTHGGNREEMLQELEDWSYTLIERKDRIPDATIVAEMKTLVWNEKNRRFEHMPGKHDDIMMALAGALITDKLLPDPVELKVPNENGVTYPEHSIMIQRMNRIGSKRRRNAGMTSWDTAKI